MTLMLDAGIFLLVLGLAFVFMIGSFKFGPVFKIIAAVLFFILAVWMMAGYQVGYKSSTYDPNSASTQNTTKYIISDTSNGIWLGWIFILFGLICAFLFIIEVVKT
jgi:Ca2+/Na+ antiporter